MWNGRRLHHMSRYCSTNHKVCRRLHTLQLAPCALHPFGVIFQVVLRMTDIQRSRVQTGDHYERMHSCTPLSEEDDRLSMDGHEFGETDRSIIFRRPLKCRSNCFGQVVRRCRAHNNSTIVRWRRHLKLVKPRVAPRTVLIVCHGSSVFRNP